MNAPDERKADIATRLALARKQAGLTQGQVAEMMNLSRPSISEMEAGRRNVTAPELAKLAEIYGVSVGWLSCAGAEKPDASRDRVQLAARQLGKLKPGDFDKVINLLEALRDEGEKK
jgi:transcriptional regulator with XRE-family HTH domain